MLIPESQSTLLLWKKSGDCHERTWWTWNPHADIFTSASHVSNWNNLNGFSSLLLHSKCGVIWYSCIYSCCWINSNYQLIFILVIFLQFNLYPSLWDNITEEAVRSRKKNQTNQPKEINQPQSQNTTGSTERSRSHLGERYDAIKYLTKVGSTVNGQ